MSRGRRKLGSSGFIATSGVEIIWFLFAGTMASSAPPSNSGLESEEAW